MNWEKFSLVILILVMSVWMMPLAQAATIYVPDDYATIQAAIDAASPGDTILVGAGTYNENLNITKQLTISGAGKNDVTLNPSTATYGIGVWSPGNSVTIEKLTVNAGSAKFFLIHVSGVSNFTLQDAKVVGPGRLVLSGGEALGGVDLINVTTAMIKDVEVKDLSRNGVSAGHSSNISLENLVVNNIGSTTGWAGVAAYTALGNTIITFSGTNTVTNTSMGLYLEDNPTRTVTITAPVGSITFSGQGVAPIVRFGYGSAPGLEVTALGLGLRARLTSPEMPAPYDKGVAFYYTVAEAVAAGALDPIGKLYAVVYDLQINEWFVGPGMVIQRAVNAASAGNKVNVAAGTYVENVVIAKSLDLIGASSATTIIDGNNIGNTVTITASNVTLSGFKVTGGWANGLDVFHPVGGVVVDGNSGDTSLTGITIEDNIIDGNLGNGVYVSAAGHGGGASNVVIKDCQISNNGGSNAGISLTYPNYIIRPVGVWDEWKRPKNILVQGNTIYSNSEYILFVPLL